MAGDNKIFSGYATEGWKLITKLPDIKLKPILGDFYDQYKEDPKFFTPFVDSFVKTECFLMTLNAMKKYSPYINKSVKMIMFARSIELYVKENLPYQTSYYYTPIECINRPAHFLVRHDQKHVAIEMKNLPEPPPLVDLGQNLDPRMYNLYDTLNYIDEFQDFNEQISSPKLKKVKNLNKGFLPRTSVKCNYLHILKKFSNKCCLHCGEYINKCCKRYNIGPIHVRENCFRKRTFNRQTREITYIRYKEDLYIHPQIKPTTPIINIIDKLLNQDYNESVNLINTISTVKKTDDYMVLVTSMKLPNEEGHQPIDWLTSYSIGV